VTTSSIRGFVYALLSLLIISLPVLVADNLPFIDYPNHLARYYLLHELEHEPVLAQFYQFKEGLYPYWAMRLVIASVYPFTDIDTAGKVFAIASLLAPIVGTYAIALAQHRHVPMFTFTAAGFAYTSVISWGLLNYALSAGIGMIVFACWIVSNTWSLTLRLFVFLTAGIALALLHMLAGLVCFGLAFAWELSRLIDRRFFAGLPEKGRLAETLVLAAPAVVLALVLRGEDVGATMSIFGGLGVRIIGLLSALWTGWNIHELLLTIALLGMLLIGFITKILKLSQQQLIFLILIMAGIIVAPFALFGVSLLNIRLPAIAVLVLIGCIAVRAPKSNLKRAGSFALLGLILSKLAIVAQELQAGSAQISEFRAALSNIETGSRVFTAITDPALLTKAGANNAFMQQIANYAIIDRHAFVPRFFSMYEIGITPKYADISQSVSQPIPARLLSLPFENWPVKKFGNISYAKHWLTDYDYIILLYPSKGEIDIDQTILTLRGTFFEIRKIGRIQYEQE
jgi:hypothetical protein